MKHTILIFLTGSILGSWCLLSGCKSTAEFTSDKSHIKENETVQFTDRSTRNPDYWNWTFTGGNPSSSSSQNPRINYPTAGTYPVSLTCGNRWGTDTESKSAFIIVDKDCKEERITPAPYKDLCPNHTGGDKDFKGHGPKVEARATLRVVNDKEIYVDLYLHEKETKDDWTECLGNWSYQIYTVPNGWKIESILTDMQSTTTYTDNDHELDVPAISGGRLVSKFEIMGDTGGNDVGNCTSDDAYLNVFFNEIRVKICEN
jgi:PKD repeat protein